MMVKCTSYKDGIFYYFFSNFYDNFELCQFSYPKVVISTYPLLKFLSVYNEINEKEDREINIDFVPENV